MRKSDRRTALQGTTIFAGMLVLALGCGESPTSPDAGRNEIAQAAATVAQVAAAFTGQDAPIANNVKRGRNIGFDTHTYPGDRTMRAWKEAPGAPYSWVGLYLPAPCHRERSWTGKRELLQSMGWGIAIVYVGQQTWNRTPKPSEARAAALTRSGKVCNADLLSADRGVAEGLDAINVTELEGFERRSIVFLDIERMEKIPPVMRDYYRAWARTLLKDGRYRPGVYVHKHNAQEVYNDLKVEFTAAGVKEEPRIWVASGTGFDEGKAPQDVGFAFAGMWQGLLDVARAVASIELPIDINVSEWSSPSAPQKLGN